MIKDIKVSIIITTYKRATMLQRAIDSVLNQTYENIEVIVVDDNDNDTEYRKQTENIMEKYKNNSKVKYIKHDKNMNGAVARNTGLKHSKGEVICFLDDDDWYLPEKIEKQLNYLISNRQFDAVYCGWIRDKKYITSNKKGDLSFELLSGESVIYTNTIMIWKHIAIQIGGWDERFKRNQEAVFLLRYFKAGYIIGAVEEVLVEFDTSDRSNSLDPKRNEQLFKFYLDEHEETIKKLEVINKDAKKIIYSLRYRGIMLNYIKNKQVKEALRVYLQISKNIPIRFNIDILKYIIKKVSFKNFNFTE